MKLSAGSVHRATPCHPLVVLVDGAPSEDAHVASMTDAAPLGDREAVIALTDDGRRAREIVIAEAYHLADQRVGLRTLMRGAPVERLRGDNPRRWPHRWRVRDSWSRVLGLQVEALPGAWVLGEERVLRIGSKANRSVQVTSFRDTGVYLPGSGTESWTAGDALRLLLAIAGVSVDWWCSDQALGRRLQQNLELHGALRHVLLPLLEDHALLLRWDDERQALGVGEREQLGQQVCFSPSRSSESPHRLLEATDADEGHSLRGSCEAPGWRVESTFELHPGWDPALSVFPDEQYNPETSDDFAVLGSVFRRWVLNEDGAFSLAPHHLPRHDLSALFGQTISAAETCRFRAPLTRDPEGKPQPVLVEVSEDGGQTWRVVLKRSLLADRAGIRISDPSLSTEYLEAARSGQARVRVTASVQSPTPIATDRWWGLAFSGVHRDVVFETGDRFRFIRVDASSRFAAEVRAGARIADEQDDTRRMSRWLLAQLERGAKTRPARIRLAGRMTWLHCGDRIILDPLGASAIVCDRIHWTDDGFGRLQTTIEGSRKAAS